MANRQVAIWVLSAGLLATSATAQSNGNPTYLAVGDSIAFGFNPLVSGSADLFSGYPEVISGTQHVQHVNKLMNLACPGETSGSFVSASVPDNGCRDYKAYFGIHTVYAGTQLSMAVQSLRAGKHIQLVTIDVGGNDLRLLQFDCNFQPGCIIAGLPAVLDVYRDNLRTILRAFREDAQYTGNIIVVLYYSPDYQDPVQTGGIFALNLRAAQVAGEFGAQIADGFTAFLQAAGADGNPCTAGLLVPLPGGGCDIHPSETGRALLADAVLQLIGKNKK